MRWSVGIIVVCLAMGLAACSNPLDKARSPERIPTGCGDCETEVAALVAAVEATPGVRAVTTTRRTTQGVPQAYLRLGLSLDGDDVVSTDIPSVVDAVAEAAWRSDVNPLDVLVLDVTLADGYKEVDRFLLGADRDAYEKRWGARPAGTEWSPVPDEQTGPAGCERDGCADLMRDIAREVSTVPGVEAVLGSTYVADSPTNASSADVTVRTDGTDVSEAVAEIVWRSQVAPIKLISVTADLGDDSFPDSTTFQIDPDIGRDHDRLAQQWGPRPVEE
jgi:hypothetical protein